MFNKKQKPIDGDSGLLIYTIIGIVGIFLIFIAHVKFLAEPWLGIINDIGSTLLAAVVVIFTVERLSRQSHRESSDKLIRDINSNLFKAIYRRQIPDSLIKEVEASIFQTKVFRHSHKVRYNFTEVPKDEDEAMDKPQHLIVQTTSRYKLQNPSDEVISTSIPGHYEMPLDEKWRQYVSIDAVEIEHQELTAQQIGEYTKRDSVQLKFEYPIQIPPQSDLFILLKVTMVKRIEDMEVFASFIPSDGLELTVHVPENYTIEATANHRCKLVEEYDIPTSKTWRLDEAILPFQSIVFWWKPSE